MFSTKKEKEKRKEKKKRKKEENIFGMLSVGTNLPGHKHKTNK